MGVDDPAIGFQALVTSIGAQSAQARRPLRDPSSDRGGAGARGAELIEAADTVTGEVGGTSI